ncbi:putative transmembrane protein, partial [Toxoplasma gondii COUG]
QRQACHKLTSRLFALRRSRLPAVQNGSVVRHQLRAAVGGVCTCPHLQRRIAGAARLRRDRKLFDFTRPYSILFVSVVAYSVIFGAMLVWFAINAFGTAVATVIVLLLAEVRDDAGTKKRATATDAVKGKPSSVAEKKQATAAVSPTAVEQGDNN